MNEFEFNGHDYRIGKLSAFQQFHVHRKIAPLIPALIPIFMKLKAGGLKGDLVSLPELLQPFADGLSAMQDEAAEYVIGTCLSVLQRKNKEKGNWVSIWNPSGKVFMFAELNEDMSSMIPLVVRVIKDSLGPFLSGLLAGTSQQTETAAE